MLYSSTSIIVPFALLSLLLPPTTASTKSLHTRASPAGAGTRLVDTRAADSPVSPSLLVPRNSTTSIDDRSLLSFDIGVCLALDAQVDIAANVAGLDATATAYVGACLCIDAEADISIAEGDSLIDVSADVKVTVQVQAGVQLAITGDTAQDIAKAVEQPSTFPASATRWPISGPRCRVPQSLLANSEPDFSKGCCGRRCKTGYFQENNALGRPRCVPNCPADKPIRWTSPLGVKKCVPECTGTKPVRQPDGTCGAGCPNQYIKCNDVCLSKFAYTCPSGIATPKKRRSALECPMGKTFCPTSGSSHATGEPATGMGVGMGGGWECIDTQSDIESCGGCADPSMAATPGFGTDCTALPGTDGVSCRRGNCHIHSCQKGWELAPGRNACVKADTVPQSHRQRVIMRRRS